MLPSSSDQAKLVCTPLILGVRVVTNPKGIAQKAVVLWHTCYQYFVDLGMLLAPEQSTDLFSDARSLGIVCLQKNTEKRVFPKSTKYR